MHEILESFIGGLREFGRTELVYGELLNRQVQLKYPSKIAIVSREELIREFQARIRDFGSFVFLASMGPP